MEVAFLSHRTYSYREDVQIIYPRPEHALRLAELAARFSPGCDWVIGVNVASLLDPAAALSRLIGPGTRAVFVAQAEDAAVAGFAAMVGAEEGEVAQLALLASAACWQSGVARQLVEAAFARLPMGVLVQARVHMADTFSCMAPARLGFTPSSEVLPDVLIFERRA